jgi:hypothetical protein
LRRGSRGWWERRKEGFSDEESFFAVGAGSKIPARELKQEVLPGWWGGSLFFLRFDV